MTLHIWYGISSYLLYSNTYTKRPRNIISYALPFTLARIKASVYRSYWYRLHALCNILNTLNYTMTYSCVSYANDKIPMLSIFNKHRNSFIIHWCMLWANISISGRLVVWFAMLPHKKYAVNLLRQGPVSIPISFHWGARMASYASVRPGLERAVLFVRDPPWVLWRFLH